MAKEKPTILIVGTLDTKESETLYLRSQILSYGTCETKLLDVGRSRKSASSLELTDDDLVHFDSSTDPDSSLGRGDFIDATIKRCEPLVSKLVESKAIHGIVSAGGSSGSSLATALMRTCCPVGFPKLMVSTMASGDIKPYIEETDITMMYSVVDIAGINSILKRILGNAAGSIVGMTTAYHSSLITPAPPSPEASSPTSESGPTGSHPSRIGITMFGVTTPCVDQVRRILTSPPNDVLNLELYIFHATGSGGRAMERLIREHQLDAVLDLTTTEIADELFGGVLNAGPERLEAALTRGIPYVISVGACDMVNFGPRDSVPQKYAERNLYVHNPTVTLMRTTADENASIGHFIADKIKQYAADTENVRVLLPRSGVSAIDARGGPFHDPDADQKLFAAIEDGLEGSGVEVKGLKCNVNDGEFAEEAASVLVEMLKVDPRKWRLANQRRRRWSFDHGYKK